MPTADAVIISPLAPYSTGEDCSAAGLYGCLDEAVPDGAGSLVYLLVPGGLRVSFSIASTDVPGTVNDLRFEVAVRGRATVAADQVKFSVYAGSDLVATVTGDEAVGPEWTTRVVAADAITRGLAGNLDTVAFQAHGPTAG